MTDAALLRVLDHVQRTTPKALTGRVRRLEAIVAKTREYLALQPRCDQEGCEGLATHGRGDIGRRCKRHAEYGWHPYSRAQAQTELEAMLAAEKL